MSAERQVPPPLTPPTSPQSSGLALTKHVGNSRKKQAKEHKPSIHGLDHYTLFEYVDPISHAVWNNHINKPHFWVLIGDDQESSSDSFNLFKSEFVVSVLRQQLNGMVDFTAIPATMLKVAKDLKFKAPHPILVTCSSSEVAEKLVEKRYIDTKKGWLALFSHDMPTSSFIIHVRAPVRDSPETRKEVLQAVRDKFRETEQFKVWVSNMCNNPAIEKLSKEQWFDKILDSMRVSPLQITENGVPVMLWRVYMLPVTLNSKRHWTVQVVNLRGLRFVGSTWVGECMRDSGAYRCNRCKGLDHPTEKCPVNRFKGHWCRVVTNSGRGL